MSSSILSTIQNLLNLYAYPIFMVLGNIGNAFIVLMFSRQRQNACSIYLLCSGIINSIYLIYNSFVQIFPFNYKNETLHAFVFCKINIYIASVIGQIAKTMIVLACVDRFLITNDRATFRTFSTPKRAKYLIHFSVIFWSLFSIHIPVMYTINNGQCGASGIYSTFFLIYLIIFVGLIPTVLSGIFGYITYRNMRQMHNRVQPIAQNTFIQRRDRELLILVISEVLVYIVTTGPFSLICLEMIISQYIVLNKSVQYLQIEIFTFNIALLLLFINSAVSFYTYLIVSKPFRRDFKQLIIHAYRKFTRQPIVPVDFRGNETLAQRHTRV